MVACWQRGAAFAFLPVSTAKEKFLKLSVLKEYKRLDEAGAARLKFSELFRANIRGGVSLEVPSDGVNTYFLREGAKKLLGRRFR